MGLAEGFEIGIFVSKFFEVVIEFDGATDVALGRSEIATLGGVAAEVKLDEWIAGVKVGGIRENFGGGIDGFAASFGEGPRDEPSSLFGVDGGKVGSEGRGFLPKVGAFEKA